MERQPINSEAFRAVLSDAIVIQDKQTLSQLIHAKNQNKAEFFRIIPDFGSLLKVPQDETDTALIITDPFFLKTLNQ